MPVPFWAGRYIGLPFLGLGRNQDGVDCWGLVRLVYTEQFGIVLPSYVNQYQSTTQVEKIGCLVGRESAKWKPVAAGSEVTGDVVVLRVRGAPMHVGLVVGDGMMLHIERGINSVIERYTSSRWQHKIFGFFRHATTNEK